MSNLSDPKLKFCNKSYKIFFKVKL